MYQVKTNNLKIITNLVQIRVSKTIDDQSSCASLLLHVTLQNGIERWQIIGINEHIYVD